MKRESEVLVGASMADAIESGEAQYKPGLSQWSVITEAATDAGREVYGEKSDFIRLGGNL